ncbi:enolase C-terminal domain-like protein [Marinicrinis lubricantis]|uniref:glucarate dehydratase n=1 Tax=Marinicrinis lubricantis TaxID=2086470 RepID=A0ABW1IJM0_9BACL
MKITDLKATTVTVPLEAPLRHSNGTHWGRFVRTIVEVVTDEGLIGYGEMGGGGESAQMAIAGLKPYLIGHDPTQLEALRFKICNPTASLYNNRTQLMASIEFACLDIIGKQTRLPVYKLLGGKLRDSVPFASYLFFRYPDEASGAGEVRTIEQLVEHTRSLKQQHGFTTHKLKGGVFPPAYELECYQALGAAFPEDRLRFDPNAAYSVEQSIQFAKAIEQFNNDYLEDPTWGMNGMRRVREKVSLPLATNTVVVNFEQLAHNILQPAVDVILLDTTFWGGVRACHKAAAVCETFQYSVAVHSSGELGIQLASMIHLGAAVPNMPFAIDAHYHQLKDDIIAGGKFKYEGGSIAVPEKPGLGVEIDRDKLNYYAEEYVRLGGYAYDRDPKRPEWYPIIPNDRWADPSKG